MPLTPESFITVENLADEPFSYVYHQRRIVLPPHTPMPIPWSHMLRIAGDPFSNEVDKRNLRADAVERMRQFHGIYSDDQRWQERHPLRFTDDEGNVVPTPYTHPDGSGASATTDPTDLAYLVSRMKKNEEENRNLKAQVSQLQAANDARAAAHTLDDAPLADTTGPTSEAPVKVATGNIDTEPPVVAPRRKETSTEPIPKPVKDETVGEDAPETVKVS